MGAEEGGPTQKQGTIARTLDILREIGEMGGEPIGVGDLSRHLDLPKSSIHRTLQILVEHDILWSRDGKYQISIGGYDLGARLAASFRPISDASDVVEEVAAECGETALLGLFLENELAMMFVAKADAAHQLRYDVPLYKSVTVAWGASGLAIMSVLSEDIARAIWERSEASPVDGLPIPPWPAFAAKLAEVQASGFAVTQSEKIDGAVGIAVPVVTDEFTGCLCVTIPAIRYRPALQKDIVLLLRRIASGVSLG